MLRSLFQKAFFPSLVFWSCVIFLPGQDSESQVQDGMSLGPITHRAVPKPFLLNETNSILVSLEKYLGRADSVDSEPSSIVFVSAGRPLTLKDAKGLVHKSSRMIIGWRQVKLQEPINIVRNVIGPFASFESAQRISQLLDQDGIKNSIAHPFDWEIWVSNNISLPEGIKSNLFKETIVNELRPVLKLGSVEYLLSGDLQINAPDGLIWNEGLYKGPFVLRPDAYGTWTFLENLSIEKYLLGVLPHEIGSTSPSTALEAQSVLARTWAISNSHRFEIDGYHLCSDTQCQVYKNPAKANYAVVTAIKKTSGKVLTWEGNPINAVYHATNGGISAAANEAWDMNSLPYLKTFLDGSSRWKKQLILPIDQKAKIKTFLSRRDGAFGNSHRLFRWKRTLTAQDINQFLDWPKSKSSMASKISVLERGPSGRVLALEIQSQMDEMKVVLRLDKIRRKLRSLPSTLFYIEEVNNGVWEFIGGGFGHGTGLSQAGAIDLALRGWTTRQILEYYYPGTTYESFK